MRSLQWKRSALAYRAWRSRYAFTQASADVNQALFGEIKDDEVRAAELLAATEANTERLRAEAARGDTYALRRYVGRKAHDLICVARPRAHRAAVGKTLAELDDQYAELADVARNATENNTPAMQAAVAELAGNLQVSAAQHNAPPASLTFTHAPLGSAASSPPSRRVCGAKPSQRSSPRGTFPCSYEHPSLDPRRVSPQALAQQADAIDRTANALNAAAQVQIHAVLWRGV